MSAIDTLYIASTYEQKDQVQNDNSQMCRYQFIECIIRMAHEKYVKSKFCKSLSQAVGVILNDHIFKNSAFVLPVIKWREEKLWNILIDDLFFANMSSIREIFSVRVIIIFYRECHRSLTTWDYLTIFTNCESKYSSV
jgi:hypothetical protein